MAAAGGEANELGEEIGRAAALIDRREYQLGRLKLMQLREQRWDRLDADQRLLVLGNLARAWLKEGDVPEAAKLFIAARTLRPEDEDSCTNEVLASELLDERERACALAESLCAKFPASGRAHALWLNNLPAASGVAELEREIPTELAGDPEVAIVMARRSMGECDYHRAEWFARKAAAASPGKSEPWLLLGQAIMLGEIEPGAPAHEPRVREAEGCLSRAIALAQQEPSLANEVHALLARARARTAIHDLAGAGRDLENAHDLKREDPNVLCEYGITLRSRGDLAEAVEIFRHAVRAGGRDDAEFQLARTLCERDLPADLQEEAELLARVLKNPAGISSADFLFAAGCAADTLSRLGRWRQAQALLAELPVQRIPRAALFTLLARLELGRANIAEASRLADEALLQTVAETSAEERRNLAALLHNLGRYGEALVLWESLVQMGAGANETRRLLECAGRLGRDEIVLEVCRNLRAQGALVEGATEFELEILERRDPDAAIRLLDDYLTSHPEDRVMQLRRSIVARRTGRGELALTDPGAMPPAREVLPSLGRVAVELMRDAGHPNQALGYAYELVRHNPGDPDAHRAYLAALAPFGPMPVIRDFETAQLGCAVCFVEQDSVVERWATLEDAPDADEQASEYGAASPMLKVLRGRRPGDKFQLPEGRFSRRNGTIKRLISKYAYRYQDCLYRWEARFGGLAEIEMMQGSGAAVVSGEIPDAPDELQPDSSAMAAGGSSREETLEKAAKTYASAALPIYSYARTIGAGDLDAVFTLASRPDSILKCCEGSQAELDGALSAYGRASSVVLDLSAIATLCLLGRLNLLRTWPRRFVIAPATLDALERIQFDDARPGLPAGFSALLDSLEPAPKPEQQLRALPDAIRSVCAVGDGTVTATVPAERREKLIRQFGLHGAQSIVLAATPGHVLWTDDLVIAALARNEFGVRRIWTQSALMARAQAGGLDPRELANATSKLTGWGYRFITPGIEMLMSAGSLARWDPGQFPLGQVLDQFATETVRIPDAVILAAELIVRLYADAALRNARAPVTARLLDRLAARPGGREAIEALPGSFPIRYGLDLIGARELSDAIRGWMAKHREESPQPGFGAEAMTN